MIVTDEIGLFLAVAAVLSLGLAILAWHQMSREKAAKRNTTACQNCGYDIRSSIGRRCPECGQAALIRPRRPDEWSHCSFCNAISDATGPQAEGPGNVFICDACIELAWESLHPNDAGAATSHDPDEAAA